MVCLLSYHRAQEQPETGLSSSKEWSGWRKKKKEKIKKNPVLLTAKAEKDFSHPLFTSTLLGAFLLLSAQDLPGAMRHMVMVQNSLSAVRSSKNINWTEGCRPIPLPAPPSSEKRHSLSYRKQILSRAMQFPFNHVNIKGRSNSFSQQEISKPRMNPHGPTQLFLTENHPSGLLHHGKDLGFSAQLSAGTCYQYQEGLDPSFRVSLSSLKTAAPALASQSSSWSRSFQGCIFLPEEHPWLSAQNRSHLNAELHELPIPFKGNASG